MQDGPHNTRNNTKAGEATKMLKRLDELTAKIEAARDSAEYASMKSSLLYICSSLFEMASLSSPPLGSPSLFPVSASYS